MPENGQFAPHFELICALLILRFYSGGPAFALFIGWVRIKLFLTSLFFGFSTIAAGAEGSFRDSEWLATGAGAKLLGQYLNSTYCNSNEAQFLACLAGAEISFAKIDSHLSLTNKTLAGDFVLSKLLDNFGDLQLAQGTRNEPVDSDWQAMILRQKSEDIARIAELQKLFPRHNVDFEKLRAQLLLQAGQHSYAEAFVFRDFMNALLSFNDPFSSLTPKTTYLRETTSGLRHHESVGLTTASANGVWLVKKAEGAAAAAGLRQGDQLLSLNGVSLASLKMDKFVEALKDPHQPVTFEALRAGSRFQVHVSPKDIVDPVLRSSLINRAGKKLLLINLRSFYDQNVCSSFRAAVLKSPAFDGVIIDLRDNGGGYLDRVTCILGVVLGPSMPVISEVQITAAKKVAYSTPKDSVTLLSLVHKPITILLNAHSASGSEIFAGALRYYDRALLVGVRSYGKGSVSDGGTWAVNDKFMITKTDGLYFFPDGNTPNKAGLLPDFNVGWRSGATPQEEFALRNEDNQHNPTPALNPPIPGKSLLVAKIQACIDNNWLNLQERSTFGSLGGSDYQLYTAEEVARCSN